MTFSELVDLAVIKAGTAAKVAAILGVSSATLSLYRNGKNKPTAWVGLALGEIAGVDPDVALVATMAARADNDEERGRWRSIEKRLIQGGIAGLFVAMLAIGQSGYKSTTEEAIFPSSFNNIHYLLLVLGACLYRRRRGRFST